MAVFAATILLFSGLASGQIRTVAITVDDLPYALGNSSRLINPDDAKRAALVNDKILNAFVRHHVPATGFVVQQTVEEIGTKSGTEILREWTRRGFDLGNHLYSHPDINTLSVEQTKNEIVRGESAISPLMKQVGKKPEFLRFPYNHTGNTKEKHNAIAAFIGKRGYRTAPCTIENSDYEFNRAYFLMLSRNDDAAAERLRSDYLAYTSAAVDYYSQLNRQVLGYEPPHIMLLHDSELNADVIDSLIALFEQKKYRFITLAEAESDPAYRTPETFITKYGPMWGYRWAAERQVQVNGSQEPVPPAWIDQYVKAANKPRGSTGS